MSTAEENPLASYPELAQWGALEKAAAGLANCEYWDCDAYVKCANSLDGAGNIQFDNPLPPEAFALKFYVGNEGETLLYTNILDAINGAITLGFRTAAALDGLEGDVNKQEWWRSTLAAVAEIKGRALGESEMLDLVNPLLPSDRLMELSIQLWKSDS